MALIGALLVGVVILAMRLSRLARANRTLENDLELAFEASQQLNAPLRRMERELEFVTEWVRQFPRLMARLGGCTQLREIPQVLVEGLTGTFEAEQAVVLVRRRSTLRDPDRGHNLIVAGVAVPETGLELGDEVALGEGPLGLAAQSRRAFDRQTLADDPSISGALLRRTEHASIDAVAPMVVGDSLIGVLGFGRAERHLPHSLDMLQAVAQLGGLALHNLWTYRRARVAADLDGLTGIFNKSTLRFRLSEQVYKAGEHGDRVAVFLFDIDHFKNYNDRNGHVAGDEALRLIARLAGESVRVDDIFGRFGGEEFLVILPGRSAAEARVAAEGIRAAIESFEFPFGDGQPLGRVTISGGVAVYPEDGRDSVEVIKAADAALYRAKNGGRSRVEAAPGGSPAPTATS